MPDKSFLIGIGERPGGTPMDADELLRSKINERKRRELERAEEIDEVKHEAEIAKYKKQTTSATVEAEKVENKGYEPPIKMTGQIDLGRISLTDQINESKRESQEAQAALSNRLDAAEEREKVALERAHQAELAAVQKEMSTRLEGLEKAIQQGFSQKTIMQQLQEVRDLAGELGFSRPDPSLPGAADASVRIQLMQLELQEKREDRAFKWKMREDEKRWQLEMQKLSDERDARRQQQESDKQKWQMFANAPQMIGGAIAKGLIDRGSQEVTEVPGIGKRKVIEANVGEAGTVPCAECTAPVAVGPTAKVAQCADCGARFSIRRVNKQPVAGEIVED